jgi:ATP-binding cassette, subfamily C, bacteriocin exporter
MLFKTKPACVKQLDQTDCGPAVLATIAKHYGLSLSKTRIRDVAGTDLRGTSLLGLQIAAERIGFHATGVRADWDNLVSAVDLPAVAHIVNDMGLGHFVVVHEIKGNTVVIADPAEGLLKVEREEFCKQWLIKADPSSGELFGTLMLLAPTSVMHREEGGTLKKTSRSARVFSVLKARYRTLLEVLLCAVCSTVLALIGSLFIQVVIDSVLVHGKTSLLNSLALGMLLLHFFKMSFGALRQYLLVHLAQKIDLELLLEYYGHVLKMPLRFFQSRQVGEILSRMSDAKAVRGLLQGTALGVILDLFTFVIASAVMFYYHATLTALVFAFLPAFVILMLVILKPIRKIQKKMMEQSAEMEGHLVESISGIETVKAFAAERQTQMKTEDKFVGVIRTGFKSAMLGLSASMIGGTISAMASLFVIWYGGHQVIEGELSLGQLMFFTSLMGYLIAPMQSLSGVIVSVQDALIALDRLSETMDLEPEQSSQGNGYQPDHIEGEFELENVTFSYGHRETVLRGVNLRIPANKTTAIVGESGSGKSTLARLLARYDTPMDGRILLDGIDLRDWDMYALRRAMGVVPQDVFLYRGKIRDNISLGAPDAPMQKIVDVARLAHAHEFISRLPERYDTLIGERGSDLSGGQRQRIAIARALLTNPRIMVLDEATSSLDTESERAIQVTLDKVKQGRTTILIAHRLSTVRHADFIVVLQQGAVVESGTHDELLALRGHYYAMTFAQKAHGDDEAMAAIGDSAADGENVIA